MEIHVTLQDEEDEDETDEDESDESIESMDSETDTINGMYDLFNC